jgi:hypothetical protein
MGNQFRVEVHESLEELQHRLRNAGTATTCIADTNALLA